MCLHGTLYFHDNACTAVRMSLWGHASLVCWSLGSRSTLAQEVFTLMLCAFGTTSHCLVIEPFLLLPSRNIWRHISLTWSFSHRHLYARWAADIMELFFRCYCWTLTPLLRPWVWLHRGYWLYSSLIDSLNVSVACWPILHWMPSAILQVAHPITFFIYHLRVNTL